MSNTYKDFMIAFVPPVVARVITRKDESPMVTLFSDNPKLHMRIFPTPEMISILRSLRNADAGKGIVTISSVGLKFVKPPTGGLRISNSVLSHLIIPGTPNPDKTKELQQWDRVIERLELISNHIGDVETLELPEMELLANFVSSHKPEVGIRYSSHRALPIPSRLSGGKFPVPGFITTRLCDKSVVVVINNGSGAYRLTAGFSKGHIDKLEKLIAGLELVSTSEDGNSLSMIDPVFNHYISHNDRRIFRTTVGGVDIERFDIRAVFINNDQSTIRMDKVGFEYDKGVFDILIDELTKLNEAAKELGPIA